MKKHAFRNVLNSLIIVCLLFVQIILPAPGTEAASEPVEFNLSGFASLNGGTTGGVGGKEVSATSLKQVNDLLNTRKKANDNSPLIIRINEKISGAGKIDIKNTGNITVIGQGTSGELDGIGISIYKSSNIIVRNLKIHHTLAPIDGIGIDSSNHIWVDHCEIYNMIGDCNGDGVVDKKGDISGGDVDWYDGLLDVKGSSEYITVSWNYFHDAFKTSLIGSSDSDTYDRKITFHHNMYKNCNSRLPSYRGGTGHIFNNYYVDIWNSAVNSRMGAKLRIEGNVFENAGSGSVDSATKCAEGPIGTYYSDTPGLWDVKDNQYIGCKGNQPTQSTCSFTPPYDYSRVLNNAGSVKSMVMQYAGTGELDGISSTQPSLTIRPYTPTPTHTPSGITTYTVSGYVAPDFSFGSSVSSKLKSGFKVELQGVSSTFTDESGRFELPDIPAYNDYTLRISKNGYLARDTRLGNITGNIQIGLPGTPISMRPGDANQDGVVNMTDIVQIAASFNSSTGSAKYREVFDFNFDGAINMLDIIIIARYFNKTSFDYPQALITIPSPVQSAIISSSPTQKPTPTATITTTTTVTPVPTPTLKPDSGDIILEPGGAMTIQQAIDTIQPGKTIYLKGGTYKYSASVNIKEGNNGSQGAMKNVFAYEGSKPVLDFSAMSEGSSNRGILLVGNYWHFKGITIRGAGDNGMLIAGNNNRIEGCLFEKNRDSGLQISRYSSSQTTIDRWPANNLILDCISTENLDSGRENADGFAAKLTSGKGNIFRNCKALYNCDDGWDLYTKSDTGAIGAVTLEDCEASGNGKFPSGGSTGGDGNGYKLGDDTASVAHILKNCTANNNYANGFTGNGNPAQIILENCSGSGNGGKLFDRLANARIIETN